MSQVVREIFKDAETLQALSEAFGKSLRNTRDKVTSRRQDSEREGMNQANELFKYVVCTEIIPADQIMSAIAYQEPLLYQLLELDGCSIYDLGFTSLMLQRLHENGTLAETLEKIQASGNAPLLTYIFEKSLNTNVVSQVGKFFAEHPEYLSAAIGTSSEQTSKYEAAFRKYHSANRFEGLAALYSKVAKDAASAAPGIAELGDILSNGQAKSKTGLSQEKRDAVIGLYNRQARALYNPGQFDAFLALSAPQLMAAQKQPQPL